MSTITKAIAAAAGISAVLLASPALAREAVDPSTLTPAPPDFFNANCLRDGQHITCTLGFQDPDIVDEPSGIVCGSTELLYYQTRSVVGKRFYDADGNLVRRHFREYMAGTFTNPETGRSVLWAQHDTVLHDLAVPGDVATGTIQFSGLCDPRLDVPSGGTRADRQRPPARRRVDRRGRRGLRPPPLRRLLPRGRHGGPCAAVRRPRLTSLRHQGPGVLTTRSA